MAPPTVKNLPRGSSGQNHDEAMKFANNEAEEGVLRLQQRKPSDIFVFPPIQIHQPVPSLIKTYLATHQRFRDLSSMNMKGSSFGRKGVPVTSPYDAAICLFYYTE
ncbi:uncharacterized protein LOC119350343 [Triticum dicoccoides]|uniref:uncharacterized protein LOC119350343 n=1 Tax=Triticum dicoccoides TaxID=85692 RepID=UPI0018903CA6|nr:uncharacterized protein LOC119350343 [Triticum dicoccoides]